MSNDLLSSGIECQKMILRSFGDKPAVLNVMAITESGVDVTGDDERYILRIPASEAYQYSPESVERLEVAVVSGEQERVDQLWQSLPQLLSRRCA